MNERKSTSKKQYGKIIHQQSILPKEGGMFSGLMLAADLLLFSQLELTDLPSLLLETHCALELLFTSFQVAATCGFLKERKQPEVI